ncbi:hypothetical protein J437_LFUL006073 [Ladona fulva]|uniref:C3H1-type domain-containing protein n=1 Tax=Ladona fulva TaxID=123851 RepID=A0A8K0JZQ5_LADFU|nr:hypothetical protein J437_LFUL006073 [Ladona fulva]
MDSDSSLDENFETKDEVAARVSRTQSLTGSPQDRNSGSESSFSLVEEEGELQPDPPGDTPKSPVGESNSIVSQEDEAGSQSSFTSSSSANASAYRSREEVQEANPEEEQDEEFEGTNSTENIKYESKEEEDGECEGSQDESNKHYPPADDAGDLSDVSDMDSRDSLEAVFAEDCKVKDTVKDPSPSPENVTSEPGKEVEDEDNSLGPKPPSPQTLPPLPPPVQHIETEQLDFEAEEQVKEVSAVNDDKEEGECEERLPHSGVGGDGEGKDDKSDGELKEGEDLEEGELTDEDETRPGEMEPRPVCRFYNRGQCTWGSSCRFVHPGVTDKGNYSMFELPRALLPVNGPPVYSPDYRSTYEKPFQPKLKRFNVSLQPVPAVPFAAPRKEEIVPVFESAWERGLRHAKEMMRKATKRKEMDIDFEEKKMNLSLGQEELDKENDYYTRPASPIQVKDEPDPWSYEEGADVYHPVGGPGVVPPIDGRQHHHHHTHHSAHQTSSSVPAGGDYWRRVHYEGVDARGLRVEAEYVGRGSSGTTERKERSRESRDGHRHHHHHPPEVPAHQSSSGRSEHHHRHAVPQSRSESRGEHHAVPERRKKAAIPPISRSSANAVPLPATTLPPEKAPGAWRDEKYPEVPPVSHSHKARGDEWADPWMRSKSPTRRSTAAAAPSGAPTAAVRSRRQQSFSSGSSYSSSSSSSRSSSRSSYSSFSSRSRSHSPRPAGVPPPGGPAASRSRHSSHRHGVPASPPPANHQAAPQPQRVHHRTTSGGVPSSRTSPRPMPPSAPRTPPLPHIPPPHASSKSRSRSPLSRAHRRRVNANSGMNAAGGTAVSRQPAVHLQLSPRHGASMTSAPPARKAVRAASPPHGDRKGMLGSASYALPHGMLTGIRGAGSTLVREPSPQLVRKALHAPSIPPPQPAPRMLGTTRAPQAAVAVAAAAAKSATEGTRRHRRRHSLHGKGGHGRRRSSASRRSQSSSHSSRSDDDDDDNSGSGSSSDSSDSSVSSSSSTSSSSSSSSDASGDQRKKPSPQVRPKRFIIDDRAALANSMKVKAMDALKLSGQKQQIKLTLKAPGSNLVSGKRPLIDMQETLNMRNRDRPMNLPMMAGKKRSAPESPPSPDESAQSGPKPIIGNLPKAAAKKAPSRREELLKQLKAVEDAIARKRSKITFPGTS